MVQEEKVSAVDRAVPIILVVGAVLSAIGFVLSFTVAPLVHGAEVTPELVADQMVSNQLLFSQKIFYFHMPVAMTSFIALVFTAVYGIRYLRSKDDRYDRRACIATEVALVFIVATMCTGVPWTRFEWGVWWTWEPRLTTYLILMLLAIGYFVLRAAFDGNEKKGAYAAVFGLIVFIDAPICFMVTRIIPSSTHPVIFRTDSGLSPDMMVGLLFATVGILMIAYGLYRARLRQVETAARIEELKQAIEQD